jgi:iron(III) transport system substrate-binding protein
MVTKRRASLLSSRTGRVAVSLTAALSFLIAGCGSDSGGSSGPGSAPVSAAQQQLYEQAIADGGNLSLFIGTSGNEETRRFLETFNEEFPDVRVEHISGTGDKVLERLMTEKRAGLNNADVMLAPGMIPFKLANEAGFIERFTPEDAHLFTGDDSAYIDGVAYAFSDVYNAVCYNPNNVSPEEIALLHDYQGWTDPRFKGRAAIVDPSGFGYRRGLTYWVLQDPNLGENWLRRIAALQPTVYNTANSAAPQVIAGEHDVLFNAMTIHGARASHDGAPLECATGPYAPAYPFSVGLVKDGPNTAAGKLFINWLLSEPGQIAVQDTFAFSARREGMQVPVVDADWWRIPNDIRYTDESIVESRFQELSALFNGLFGAAKS